MTIILGAFGADLAPLRHARSRTRPQVAGFELETVQHSAHTHLEIQAGASAAKHFAARPSLVDPKRAGVVVLADGDICNSAGGFGASGAHSSCTLVERPAEEILLRVEARGRKAIGEIHGSFAAAIYDESEALLTLCRDRMGVKPLFYFLTPFSGVAVAFSTSLRALAALPLHRRFLSTEGAASFLTNGFVMEPLTMLAGARALLPGQSITIRLDGEIHETAVFRKPEGDSRTLVKEETVQQKAIRTCLDESVSRQLPSRGNYCLLLSGGVDSSTLASVITRDLDRKLDTFSLVFDDEVLSESKYSRAVATKLGTAHHEVLLKEREFTGSLEAALQALDQPTTDAMNAYYISRECKRAGFDFCFAGIGSDELFGGHDCFQRVPRALRGLKVYHRLPAGIRSAARTLAHKLLGAGTHDMPSAGVRGKLVSLLDQEASVLPVYLLSRRVLLPELAARLVPSQSADDVRSIPEDLTEYLSALGAGNGHVRERISLYEQVFYLSNQLLRDLEGVSSALGLRFGLPFVDQTLVETVSRSCPDVRFRGPLPKQLLIDSVKDILPTEAYLRPKQGFVLPIGGWLEGELAARIDTLTEDAEFVRSVGLDPDVLRSVCQDCRASGGDIFYTRSWSVFILLDWCRRSGLSVS